MSNTLLEAQSADPYVRKLARNAIRLLNDPTLDRAQRERHIRHLQSLLLEHQAKEKARSERLAKKQLGKTLAVPTSGKGSGGVKACANPLQVAAMRKELSGRPAPQAPHPASAPKPVKHVRKVRLLPRATPQVVTSVVAPKEAAANDGHKRWAQQA